MPKLSQEQGAELMPHPTHCHPTRSNLSNPRSCPQLLSLHHPTPPAPAASDLGAGAACPMPPSHHQAAGVPPEPQSPAKPSAKGSGGSLALLAA